MKGVEHFEANSSLHRFESVHVLFLNFSSLPLCFFNFVFYFLHTPLYLILPYIHDFYWARFFVFSFFFCTTSFAFLNAWNGRGRKKVGRRRNLFLLECFQTSLVFRDWSFSHALFQAYLNCEARTIRNESQMVFSEWCPPFSLCNVHIMFIVHSVLFLFFVAV